MDLTTIIGWIVAGVIGAILLAVSSLLPRAYRWVKRRRKLNLFFYWNFFWCVIETSVLHGGMWAVSSIRRSVRERLPGRRWFKAASYDRREFGWKSPWRYWINRIRHRPDQLRILQELTRVYDETETELIRDGKTVTTWEAYGKFVQAMVDLRKLLIKGRTNQQIYMVTYIFFPPLRWFNYGSLEPQHKLEFESALNVGGIDLNQSNIDLTHPCFSFHHTVGEWEDYTEFAAKIAADNDHRLVRYLLCFDQSAIDYQNSNERGGRVSSALRTDKVEKSLLSWIVCEEDSEVPHRFSPSNEQDMEVFNYAGWNAGWSETMKTYYETGKENREYRMNYDGAARFAFYCIVPDEALANPTQRFGDNLCWRRVGTVMAGAYQATLGHGEPCSYFAIVDEGQFKEYFDANPAGSMSQRVPEDFFMVSRGPLNLDNQVVLQRARDATGTEGSVEKLFGLAVTNPDPDLRTLEFRFIAPDNEIQGDFGNMNRILTFIENVCHKDYAAPTAGAIGGGTGSRSVKGFVDRENSRRRNMAEQATGEEGTTI